MTSAGRGSALGLMHSVVSAMSLPADLIAGLLWDRVGSAWTFAFGGGAALVAVVALQAGPRARKPEGNDLIARSG